MRTAIILVPVTDPRKKRLEMALSGWRIEYFYGKEISLDVLEKAEIIFGEPEPASLTRAKTLKWLALSWAGADRYAKYPDFPEGVTLTCASGAYGVTIAEHAMAMALSLCRRLPGYAEGQKNRVWKDLGAEKLISGSTALVLGTGDLGSEIARRLKAFGASVIGVRRHPSDAFPPFDEIHGMDSLDALLPRADFLFGCLPDTPRTKGILNLRTLKLLPEDAVLVNVGRGSLIVTSDLETVLTDCPLLGAGLDVTDPEPLPPESPLWTMPNVILTPHVAGVGFGHAADTGERIWDGFIRNCACYLNKEKLGGVIDLSEGYASGK